MPQPYLTGSKLILGTIALSLVNFMVILDLTIANVSLPTIAGSLAVSSSQGTWVITSYAVAEAIVVPLTGWLAQRFGAVRMLVACVGLFTLSSLLCGLSGSLGMLVFMRVIQGVSGGPVMPLSQTLLLAAYPREKTGKAMMLWALTTLLAPILGPILGGLISENLSWHWIFYINVPVGVLCAVLVWTLFHKRETETRRIPVDFVGLALLIASVGCFQIVLDKGKELDWFGSNVIVALTSISVVGFILFLVWELTEKNPIVDLSLFKDRNFAVSVSSIALFYGIMLGSLVLIPLWLQTQMGYTSEQSGFATAPQGMGALLSAIVVGRLSGKYDPRIMVSIGTVVLIVAFLMRSTFTTDVTMRMVMLPQFIQGLGTPMMFLPIMTMSLAGIPQNKVANAAGLQNFLRSTAGAFGASITSTLWEHSTIQHRADLVSHVSNGGFATDTWRSTLEAQGFPPPAITALLSRTVDGQAVMLATNEIFRSAALLFLLVPALIWIARPKKTPGSQAQAAVH